MLAVADSIRASMSASWRTVGRTGGTSLPLPQVGLRDRQLVGFLRAPGAGEVRPYRRRVVEQRREHPPRLLDLLGMDEQSLIAVQHVEQEGLVGLWHRFEHVLVVKAERDPLEPERIAG